MRPEMKKMKNLSSPHCLSAPTYFNINPRHILSAAAEAPDDQPGELVVSGVLAYQRSSAVSLR